MSKVSIIIPTFNRAAFLEKAVSSVLEQTFTDFELFVIDDGSTDNTQSILSKFTDKRLKVITQNNQGVSSARNLGIRHSNGAYLAFLDSDDYWLTNKLERQMQYFSDNPECVIQQTQEIWIRHGKRVNQMKKHAKPRGDIFEASLKMCMITPSSVIMHHTVLEDVGLFDESLPACEDYDLWLRISCKYKVALIDENLIVKHGGHTDQLSRSIPSLDQYRIFAMEKSLKANVLTEPQRKATITELKKKGQIYANGCRKHGKQKEALRIEAICAQF